MSDTTNNSTGSSRAKKKKWKEIKIKQDAALQRNMYMRMPRVSAVPLSLYIEKGAGKKNKKERISGIIRNVRRSLSLARSGLSFSARLAQSPEQSWRSKSTARTSSKSQTMRSLRAGLGQSPMKKQKLKKLLE